MVRFAEVTPDGWVTDNQFAFRMLTEYAPPRNWGYLNQIRCDVREPLIVYLWVRGFVYSAVGVGLVVGAVATGQYLLLLGALLLYRGFRLLSGWVRLANMTIESVRFHASATVVIDGIEPHPIFPAHFDVSQATRPTGEKVDVAMDSRLARSIERAGFPAEVQFLDDPNSQYRSVFEGRPTSPQLR